MSIKRWKLGWKRCDCVKCDHALTVEQTEENCGWVMWEHHKEEVARLKAENENAWGSARTYSRLWIEAKENKERLEAENARLKEENNLLRMRAIDDPVVRKAMLEVIQERAKGGQA